VGSGAHDVHQAGRAGSLGGKRRLRDFWVATHHTAVSNTEKRIVTVVYTYIKSLTTVLTTVAASRQQDECYCLGWLQTLNFAGAD
jgi:hypothetical protein